MSMTFFTGPDGRTGYRIRVSMGKDRNGKYISKCHTVYGTAIQAKAVEERLQATADLAKIRGKEYDILLKARSMNIFVKQVKFADAFDLAMKQPNCRSTSEKRIAFHRNYWMDFAKFMNTEYPNIKTIQSTQPEHAEEYFARLRRNGPYTAKEAVKLSPYTINEILRTLKQVYALLLKMTGMVDNPFADIMKVKGGHAERQAYTDSQLKLIFDTADEYLYPMFFIGLFTGFSEGDVCTLKKSEINFDRHHIYRKRNKTASYSAKVSAIPMLPVLEEYLKDIVSKYPESEYVLPEHADDYLHDRSRVSKRIKHFLSYDCEFETTSDENGNRTRKQSVLDFHSLRHTFCSISGCVGIPLPVVQNIVGHMTPEMTALYSRHVEEQDRLKWIQLFGDRMESMCIALPYMANVSYQIPQECVSDNKQKLLDMVKNMSEEEVAKLLASAH